MLLVGDLPLVLHLVLKTGPEVHGNGADLHLHLDLPLLPGEEHRDADDQVQAAVTVGLGVLDIILFLHQGDIILAGERIGQGIDVIHIGADHPDAGQVMDLRFQILHGEGDALADHFLNDAGTAFQPGLDGGDRVALIADLELRLQHLKLGLHLLDGAGIHHPQLLIVHRRFQQLLGKF